ncbi:protease [Lentzea sp. NBRC 105346]|uniref:alpha/beta hydrolase n=1 Tax=Lentzea sp. NBRC 105346 TaxID=3032205 RepID=UPI0024A03E55|nr:alpha/beta hydrolase [Lentzea sp. NBRC 105346]GLZ35993.1 protease [Lentzea sp. NBRC 105346]
MRAVALGLAVFVLLGCAPNAAEPQAVAWTDCADLIPFGPDGTRPEIARRLDVGCGTLEVPLDHEHADGQKISLKLIRLHHREQTDRIGSLVLNPGGPGASGVDFAARFVSMATESLLKRFDVIGFDPRGVGESAPIKCNEGADLDRMIDTIAPVPDEARRMATSCAAKLGASAQFFNTEATARDLDLIRRATGDARLTYAGFSYGAKLGATYAHLFPASVRALVLDGPSFPLVDDLGTAERQLRGFEDAFDEFARDCATRPSCRELGDLRALVAKLVTQAQATPLTHENPADRRRTSGGTVLHGVLSALYDNARWQPLEDALRLGLKGDGTTFFDLSDAGTGRRRDGTYPNMIDAGFVINCTDGATVPTEEQITSTAARWAKDYPLFGVYQAGALYGCRYWDAPKHPPATPTAPAAPPILVIGTVHDPATPYQGAVELAATLGSGVLLTSEGEGHTAYLRSPCVDKLVETYLISGNAPKAGTRCPA